MPVVSQKTPANLWRAFFLLSALGSPIWAAAPVAPPDELSQFGKPNPAQAAQFLDDFRRTGMPGQYYIEFELQTLPRRGESKTFQGRMWAGREKEGAINRIEVTDGAGQQHRLLVQDGPPAAVWRLAAGEVKKLEPDAMFTPLIPGVEVTAFDLQRPYLFWPDATLESIHRVLGRPAYAYLFRPPAGFTTGRVASARAYFDTQFKQPLQSELLDAAGKVTKTLSVVSLKTVTIERGKEDVKQTVPKEVDFRNEATRDKTRFRITAAAFRVTFPGSVFDPAKLGADVAAPAADRLIRIEP